MAKESITHAAIVAKNGMILLGKCHADCFHQAFNTGIKTNGKAHHQGFFTSKGRYVIREVAARIAVRSGQMPKGTKVLCSEDLWSERHGGKFKYTPVLGYYKDLTVSEAAGMSIGLSDNRPD